MKPEPSEYASRLERVCDYIDKNPEHDLSVETLSRVAGLSRFHFHRQFTGYTGISVFRYVQRVRLKRAAYRLVFRKDLPIIEIAIEAGFENPESFSRMFRKAVGQTPSRFRKTPDWSAWQQTYMCQNRMGGHLMDVELVWFEPVKVAVLEHHGAPERLNHSIGTFIEWRKSSGLSSVKTSRTFGIAYNDPASTDKFQWDICGEVRQDVPENPQGVVTREIPGGRCAKMRHIGSHELLEGKVRCLYEEWLPDSGETPRDFPLFFHYLNLYPDVPESELITDIYLPLR